MTNKSHLGRSILISVIITFFGCLIVSVFVLGRQEPTTQNPTITSSVQIPQLATLQDTILAMIEKASRSVVDITISKNIKAYADSPAQVTNPVAVQTLGGGAGLVVDKDGYILTNKHVVQDLSAKYEVTLDDGKIFQVQNIRLDPILDIALLKIDATGTNLQVATILPLDQSVRIGQFVFAIGNPFGQSPHTVTFGIISSQHKKFTINNTNTYIGLYQTDALLRQGNSGGPLLDIDGQVLGINTAVASGQGMSFALPISREFVETTVASVVQKGKINRPLLGIQYVDLTPALQAEKKLPVDAGIFIKDVLAGLPAAEAGLHVGDIVTAINGKDISPTLPLLYHVYTYLPGATLTFSVIRNGETMQIPVVLGENG